MHYGIGIAGYLFKGLKTILIQHHFALISGYKHCSIISIAICNRHTAQHV